MVKLDENMKNLIIECLTEMRSLYGRTVEQAWDDVPLESWEESAIIIIEDLQNTDQPIQLDKVIQPWEINVKRMMENY